MKKYLLLISVGFFITVLNNTDVSRNCFLYWVDHPYHYNEPVNIHGGEYDPGESFTLSQEYKPGIYKAQWTIPRSNETKTYFFVSHDRKKITLTPTGVGK